MKKVSMISFVMLVMLVVISGFSVTSEKAESFDNLSVVTTNATSDLEVCVDGANDTEVIASVAGVQPVGDIQFIEADAAASCPFGDCSCWRKGFSSQCVCWVWYKVC